MHRFRIDPEEADERPIRLRGQGLRHLRDVLRLRVGARIEIFDGRGRAWVAEVRSVGPTSADVLPVDAVDARRDSALALTVAVGLSKGSKLDWTIEKLTELGVDRIVPFTSERTVPSAARRETRTPRWRTIASSAAAQSGRATCPEVEEIASFESVLALGQGYERRVLFWEDATESLASDLHPKPSVLLITGGEGGFSQDEANAAERSGFMLARLGPRTLRAETAPIVAATLAQFLWGDLGGFP